MKYISIFIRRREDAFIYFDERRKLVRAVVNLDGRIAALWAYLYDKTDTIFIYLRYITYSHEHVYLICFCHVAKQIPSSEYY